jgi:predicted HTH transcriptional regulator
MNSKTLRSIIELGESDTVEFKRKFSGFEKIAKEMIALANTRGGMLLIGVDDDGSIIGVDSEKSEIELVIAAGEVYSDPPIQADIDIVDIDDVDVIVVNIPESRNKPHRLVSRTPTQQNGTVPAADATNVYIRHGERSMMASKEVVRVLEAYRPDAPPLRLEIGDIERALFAYLERNGRATLREYRQVANISERRASRSLVRLVRAGLIRIFTHESEDYYTLA